MRIVDQQIRNSGNSVDIGTPHPRTPRTSRPSCDLGIKFCPGAV